MGGARRRLCHGVDWEEEAHDGQDAANRLAAEEGKKAATMAIEEIYYDYEMSIQWKYSHAYVRLRYYKNTEHTYFVS